LVAPERGRRARSLPDASSWVTVAQPRTAEAGAPGVIVTESSISSIIDGKLAYRGYPIEEVVARATFEEVCLLLWDGERAAPEDVALLRGSIARAKLPAPIAATLAALGEQTPPILRLSATVPSLAAWERRGEPRPRVERAKLIISMLPLALARDG